MEYDEADGLMVFRVTKWPISEMEIGIVIKTQVAAVKFETDFLYE